MNINKEAVKADIQQKIKSFYAETEDCTDDTGFNYSRALIDSVSDSYKELYKKTPIKIKGIKDMLAYYHSEINMHLDAFINNTETYFYNRKGLLKISEEARQLIYMLNLIDYPIRLIRYDSEIKYIKNTMDLNSPQKRKIEIYKYEPIFGMSEDSKIIETKNIEKLMQETAKENLQKCKDKIKSGDFSGAVTNSRSLVESVIPDLYKQITGNDMESTGDLPKDWNNLAKELNLHSREAPRNSLKQVLSGLSSIINGLAAMRNKMSDGHGSLKRYNVDRHHAVLAVNSAIIITNFLFETYEYQMKKKKVKPQQKD